MLISLIITTEKWCMHEQVILNRTDIVIVQFHIFSFFLIKVAKLVMTHDCCEGLSHMKHQLRG